MKKGTLLLSILTLSVACASQAAERTGEQVFAASCAMCHTAGLAGAPRLGEKADWTARLPKGKPTLYKHVQEGFNVMPPKGACGNCSDQELNGAVDYMLAKSK